MRMRICDVPIERLSGIENSTSNFRLRDLQRPLAAEILLLIHHPISHLIKRKPAPLVSGLSGSSHEDSIKHKDFVALLILINF